MFQKTNKQPSGGLKIIIVGCGKVGSTLLEELSKEGHELSIIDQRSERIMEMTNMYDILGICGNGASYSVQKEAGIENADLVIAVTDSDELNLLCCTIAKRVGNCATIARVRTPDYSKEVGYLRDKLGLAMIINPELEAAKEASHVLFLPTALEVNSFAHGQAEMVKFKVPAGNELIDMSIAHLGRHITNEILICAVEREGEVYIPSGNFILREGDVVSFVSNRKVAREFLHKIGFETRRVKNCLIVGGGRAAYYLAKELLRGGIRVTIIERDFKRCEELSVQLPKAVVINGDGTDKELLKEAGIEEAEAFVALTGIDEENILLTLHAKKVSNAKVVTKINRITFTEVIDNLDLGSVIYPKYITSEAIIAYVRARKASKCSNVETLYHMFNHRVEAIEFKAQEESAVTNIAFKDMHLKKDLLVACIARKGSVIIPSGDDCILPGDTVMIVTRHTGFNELTDIMA
ncbi:Trk system potassium transporter TrkA [Agathobacter ruminis]|uniref:Trk system potassium uptake protein TrkA n=1 Tax=Agathobacter ruminis TaxID=1712665 RepID=A0A2G3DZR5_9FIRM|nr:Trk system potassium transporter TrkA [Agathobacter ruminis]PHU36373.1 Trk system potassium transporter TrkA [Agathobacter ruminis]